jgi:hypothetical protein
MPNTSQPADNNRQRMKEEMRNWFQENYTEPYELPVDHEEGGYLWIWGRFDAHDVLKDQFGKVVPEDLIDELADELTQVCAEWSGMPCEE